MEKQKELKSERHGRNRMQLGDENSRFYPRGVSNRGGLNKQRLSVVGKRGFMTEISAFDDTALTADDGLVMELLADEETTRTDISDSFEDEEVELQPRSSEECKEEL